MLEKIINICHNSLYSLKEAKPFLSYLDSRISRESQLKYKFGYFPIHNLNIITSQIHGSSLEALSLIYSRIVEDSLSCRTVLSSFFDNHPLVMPYNNAYNETIAIVGRTILDEEMRQKQKINKYKNTIFNKGSNLFNLNFAISSIIENDKVYVVEGQIDCIRAFEYGIYNIVAIGSSNITDYQIAMLLRYTKNIKLLLNSDSAGQEGINKAISKFSEFANLSHLHFPLGYKDLDDFFKDFSSDEFNFLFK